MPAASIPRWLRPTMMNHAELLLEAWQQGRSLPPSAFPGPAGPGNTVRPSRIATRQVASEG
jgi:hypothetical protein